MIRRVWEWFCDQVLFFEGSTRTTGLLRIALVLVVWSRWAAQVAPFTSMTPDRLLLCVSFYLSTTLMFFGLFSRLATTWTAVTLLTMVFWFGPNGVEPWTHHHTTLLALSVAILAFAPTGGSYSVDRWLAVRKAEREDRPPPPEIGPLWALRMVGFNVSVVYFWTAVDKTTWGFLSGARLEQILMSFYWGSDYPTWPGFHALILIATLVVVVLEYALPFALWVPRWQHITFPVGFVLHGLFYILLPVGTFTMTIYALYLAYLDPDAVHRGIDRLSGHPPGVPDAVS